MKVGFEVEAFVFNQTGEPVLVPSGLPYDECGWLAEVRSEPHSDVTKALFLLRAGMRAMETQAKELNVFLVYLPLFKIPRELKVQAARAHGKGLLRYQNLYGHQTHRCGTEYATASLHVSVTNTKIYRYSVPTGCQTCNKKEDKTFEYPGFVDHAKLIVGLDRAFKDEIAKAKRNPGFYEVKFDGRIEYRSLPNDVNLDKLETVLQELLK